tara:strand:+ start:327 stop:491 length:165 start_codon:yes stop_codon:yes gene_type:complete
MKNSESMIQTSSKDKPLISQLLSTLAVTDGTDLEKKTKLESASSSSIKEIEISS